MNFEQLVAELNLRKIELWIDDWTEEEESISFFWPNDGIPESLIACITRHEEALKDMVRAQCSLAHNDWTPEQHAAFKKEIDSIMAGWDDAVRQATQQKEA